VLAGLIQDTDRRNSNHIPGLGDIPVVGRLFGTQSDDAVKTEIVLSITPRIIRSQSRASSENVEFFYGTDANPGVPYMASSSGPAPMATASGPAVVAASPAGATAPSSSSMAAAASPDLPVVGLYGPGQVRVGQDFEVAIGVTGGESLRDLMALLQFDTDTLEFLGGEAAELVPAEERQAATPGAVAGQMPGRVQFQMRGSLLDDEGDLCVLRFRARQPQPRTALFLQRFTATDAGGEPADVVPARPLVIVVTP